MIGDHLGQNLTFVEGVWLVHWTQHCESPQGWLLPVVLVTLRQPQKKRVAGFNQGRNLLAGCSGGMQGHGALGIAMSILERADLRSQVIESEVQKKRGGGQGRVKSDWRA